MYKLEYLYLSFLIVLLLVAIALTMGSEVNIIPNLCVSCTYRTIYNKDFDFLFLFPYHPHFHQAFNVFAVTGFHTIHRVMLKNPPLKVNQPKCRHNSVCHAVEKWTQVPHK